MSIIKGMRALGSQSFDSDTWLLECTHLWLCAETIGRKWHRPFLFSSQLDKKKKPLHPPSRSPPSSQPHSSVACWAQTVHASRFCSTSRKEPLSAVIDWRCLATSLTASWSSVKRRSAPSLIFRREQRRQAGRRESEKQTETGPGYLRAILP